MWLGTRARTAFAGAQMVSPVVKLPDGQSQAAPLSPPSLTTLRLSVPAVAHDDLTDDSSVEHAAAALANGTAPSPAAPGLLPAAMGDLFSLSLFQLLSILSFLTSLLAVVRVGSVSLHKLSQHKSFAADVPRPESDMHTTFKLPSWSLNWGLSGLPVSFSLNTLIGEDEGQPEVDEKRSMSRSGYTGGASLVRVPMDWQVNRTRIVPSHPQHSQPPISMAKLIMTRHFQRKAPRVPRRMSGMARPAPTSRLASECIA